MSRQDDIKKLILNSNRRLQKLKEQKALRGLNTPSETLLEIEDVEAEIEQLQTELEEIGDKVETPPRPETAAERVSGKLNLNLALAFAFGVVFVGVVLILAIVFPEPAPFQYTVFRIVLSLAAAGVAAVIPGFITLNLSLGQRVGIGAAGAFAVFAIVYFLNPAQLAGVEEPETFEPARTGESLIVVARFDDRSEGGIPPGVDPSSVIYDFMLDGTPGSKVRVERLTQIVGDTETAKKVGEQYQASLVIWGWYDSLRIQPYIELIGQRTLLGEAVDIATPTPVAFFFRDQAPTKAAYLGLFSIGLTHVVVESASELRQAISYFDAALEITEGWEALMWRANCYMWLSEYDIALRDYDRALALNPEDASGYYNRAFLHSHLNNHQQALDDYTHVIAIKPDYAEAYFGRGNSYGALGEYQQAIDDYTQAIAIEPDYALAYANRGTAYKQLWLQGEPTREKAIADFEKVLELIDDPTWRTNTENDLKELRAE